MGAVTLTNIKLKGLKGGRRTGNTVWKYNQRIFNFEFTVQFPHIWITSPYKAWILSGKITGNARRVSATVNVHINYKTKKFHADLSKVDIG